MITNFTVQERVVLLGFVPQEGNLLFLKMVQKLMGDLSFSEQESKLLGFHQTLKGQVIWDEKAAKGINKNIEIPDTLKDQIVSKLNKLNNNNRLSIDHICLCEKFGIL